MVYRAELVFQLDDGTYAFLPRPPAATSGQDYALVSTDGVLHWVATSGGSLDDILIDDATGDILFDDETGNILVDG